MDKKTAVEKVDEVRKRGGFPDLVIKRVPKHELEWFREWAHSEFEGDYGMALKHLVGVFGEYHETKDTLNNLIGLLTLKEKQLMVNEEPDEKKVVKMGSGRIMEKK